VRKYTKHHRSFKFWQNTYHYHQQKKTTTVVYLHLWVQVLVSGLIKTVEGVVSLGAELVDYGADSNTAADVEQVF
jgi:hypothetical protein